jgi:hypothetical protein
LPILHAPYCTLPQFRQCLVVKPSSIVCPHTYKYTKRTSETSILL